MGVAWNGSADAFASFVAEHGLTFPQIDDDAGYVYDYYDVASQPAIVVVGPNGSVRTRLGAVTPEDIDALVDDALA